MYSINGIPLDNTTYGWSLLRRSQMLTPAMKSLVTIDVPGRNGVIPGIRATSGAPMTTMVVRTPGTSLEVLYSVFQKDRGVGTLVVTADTSRYAVFELVSIEPEGINGADELINVTITIRLPYACWRASDISTQVMTPASPVHTDQTIFTGLSAEIEDPSFFLAGNFGNFEVRDNATGSWVKSAMTWPHVSGTGLLYVPSLSRAYRANVATPWTPGTGMSQYIDVSGNGGLRLSPTWFSDPTVRAASVTLTTTNQSGVSLTFRARNAYSIRKDDL